MEPRELNKLHYLPLIMGIELVFGMVVCFLIALLLGHVSAYVPFISDTGALLPESGIFGLFLIIGANLAIVTMIIRFLIIAEFNGRDLRKIDVINSISLFVGIVSLFGMYTVGVYPVSGNVTAHVIGALTLFFGTTAYGFLQALLTYWMCPSFNGIWVFRIRLAISTICTIFIVIITVLLPLSQRVWNASHSEADKTPKDKGFAELLTSALCEWMMVISFILFFFTYVREFRKVIIRISVTPLVNHFDEEVDLRHDESTYIHPSC